MKSTRKIRSIANGRRSLVHEFDQSGTADHTAPGTSLDSSSFRFLKQGEQQRFPAFAGEAGDQVGEFGEAVLVDVVHRALDRKAHPSIDRNTTVSFSGADRGVGHDKSNGGSVRVIRAAVRLTTNLPGIRNSRGAKRRSPGQGEVNRFAFQIIMGGSARRRVWPANRVQDGMSSGAPGSVAMTRTTVPGASDRIFCRSCKTSSPQARSPKSRTSSGWDGSWGLERGSSPVSSSSHHHRGLYQTGPGAQTGTPGQVGFHPDA